jgi:uncharacterized NAD-dependent epimerase/dehydratase family protein
VLGIGPGIPIVATLDEALVGKPDALLIGVAPAGGQPSPHWQVMIRSALERGLDVISGLHRFFGDDPELAAAAERGGARIFDLRRPPEGIGVALGVPHRPSTRTLLTVGTDCATGKMSVALELRAAAVARGVNAGFVPTGQTGIMIEGWGISVDRVIGDFMAGAVEAMTLHATNRHDLVFVEGQGSIAHPAYSGVTLALLHGARAEGLVLCHQVTRHATDSWNSPVPHGTGLPGFVELHERLSALLYPSGVVAIALNTFDLDDGAARQAIRDVEATTGLTTDDPLRYGANRLLDAVLARTPAAA